MCKAVLKLIFQQNFFVAILRLCALTAIFALPVFTQKIAVITPDKSAKSRNFSAEIEKKLSAHFTILDSSLAEAAFSANEFENPFNLSTDEAKILGSAVGCHFFLLVKHETLRRASLKKADFYESFTAIYLINSRTGKLVLWKLESFKSETPLESEKKLFDSIDILAKIISDAVELSKKEETLPEKISDIEELPAEDSPAAKNFRPPLPYRRISPVYTETANLYSIAATVDIQVDISETGKITRTEITRWAGYGLDESVTEAVRKMNWRPAERNRKPVSMRILLRYNFKDIEEEN